MFATRRNCSYSAFGKKVKSCTCRADGVAAVLELLVRVASGDANDAGFAVVACAKAHALEQTRCLGHGLFHHDVRVQGRTNR